MAMWENANNPAFKVSLLVITMGFFNNFLTWLKFKKKEANILIVGLDNSGKSTVVQYFQSGGQRTEIVPTIGFRVEKIKNAGLTLTAFDMSGQSKYRSLWERYYADCHGVVFVIDSSDTMRMAVASNELQLLIQHPEMVKNRSTTIQQGVPILILANKSDLDMAIPIGQIRAELRLDDISTHPIHLEASNALTGVGLHAGLKWLSDQIMQTI